MERILLELDPKTARELERVAPVARRKRAEFIRQAIRRALDLALDRETEEAYRAQPPSADVLPSDSEGWDPNNALARPKRRARKFPSRARNRKAR
jgi:hypothetical protein